MYFVQPTADNITRIAEDCKAKLYNATHLNFCSPLSRSAIQRLAGEVAKRGGSDRVSRVLDQYSDFVSLDPRLVTLGMKGSFVRLTRPASEKALFSYVDKIVDSLFSIVVTTGQVPIIRCAQGNAAALAAQRLHARLREHLMLRNNLFSNSADAAYKRPVVILLDRSADMTVPLHHPWTYQALVHDILKIELNKVSFKMSSDDGKASAKDYDLSQADNFWQEFRGSAIPQVAEGVSTYLADYNAELKKMGDKRDIMSDLQSAVNSMPELMRRKRTIDAHTNIAHAVMTQLTSRQWDRYFELEEELISSVPVAPKDIVQQTQPEAKGTPSDKLRLYMIYSLTAQVSPEDEKAIEAALAQCQAPQNPLKFLKQYKVEQRISAPRPASQTAKGSDQGLFSNLTKSLSTKGAQLLTNVGLSVRNLIPPNKTLPTTKLIASLIENKESQATNGFLYYDPKLVQVKGPIRGRNRITTPFADAFVFVMGGGNYVEYQNLQDYAKAASTPMAPVSVTYGSTEILSADGFLEQMAELGRPEGASGAAADALDALID